jgi:hypothetical protein
MAYFEDGSRSCLRCGALVPDPNRDLHIEFHTRIDPEPAETEQPVQDDTTEEPA